MPKARQAQLALSLEPESLTLSVSPVPEAVIEALADLLLEAYGREAAQETETTEIVDER